MVPPEELEKAQPTTLPADFGEWDSGESSATQPGDFGGFDAAPKPPVRTAPARVAPPPVAARPTPAPQRVQAKPRVAAEAAYQPPPPKKVKVVERVEEEDEPEVKSKTMTYAIAGSAVLLAVLGSGGYFMMGHKAATPNQSVVMQGSANSSMSAKPSASSPTEMAANSSSTTTPSAADQTANANTDQQDSALRAEADKMNQKLNAPSRISDDLKKLAGRDAAPTQGFGAGGGDSMGSSNVSFGQSGTKVKVETPRKVTLSNGVSTGLLIQRTAPIYPPIAKTARVSGTVVIQATISKTGLIENTHVVSGPTMLRQSALDAVKTWRFRPYLLDGEPVEVDTTVNVVFNLAG